MSDNALFNSIINDGEYASCITAVREIPAVPGKMVPFPEDLSPRLAEACRARGMESLYSHQGEAWVSARGGQHTVVVTPTASGKTLCYNLPVMQALLDDDAARALYLFPTKALSQDQQSEINDFVRSGSGSPQIPLSVNIYDGDTPQSVRAAAREKARIVISNPDMMHAGILPNHTAWIRFFSNLKFIVIDEMHIYRGVFGSHMANLLRRIFRIARFYGSNPVCILCSATIANPRELAESLLAAPVTLIDRNGAPSGVKTVVLYNPPLVDAVQGIRRSVMNESRRWALSFLKKGVKTILFAHSRVRTEVIASYINKSLANIYNGNQGITVVPYRGGLLPLERRKIEKGLRDGEIQGVVSTNALELGIDIGGLDAAVVAGFPGSFASFWQQAGRAGRRQTRSAAVFIASSSPLDQYIIGNPDYFFSRPGESAHIDPDNPYILTDHLKCAAFELPFTDADIQSSGFPAAATSEILAFLEEDGVLRHTGGRWHWSDRSYPSEAVSLRSATADNVVIVDTTAGSNTVIGEMDRPSARELLFPNAVYIHLGRQYLVTELDLPNRKALVQEADVNYFTDAVVKTDIRILTEDETVGEAITVCDLLVRNQVTKFKKLRFNTHENIGYGEVALDAEEHETRGLVFRFPPGETGAELTEAMRGFYELDEESRSALLSGLAALIRSVAPFFLLCDRRDIGVSPRSRDPFYGVPALYIYDTAPGGTGLSEALSLKIAAVFEAAAARVRNCPCLYGCPSCVGTEAASEQIKATAALVLESCALLTGENR